jgi:hypothetical protein
VQPAEFPDTGERRPNPWRSEARSFGQAPGGVIAELSGELAEQLAANEAARVVVDPRTVPVRFSRLKHMSASALHYWQSVQDNKDDTIAMRFGRGVHALVLGLPVKRWTGKTRHGKAWDAFKAKHADKEILNTKEWDRAHGIFEAIQRHPIANEALFGGTVLEETIEWEFMGRASARAGPTLASRDERLVDLKTTKCAEPGKFERDAIWRGYHAQFSFYGRAMKERFGSASRRSRSASRSRP